ncbi:MAG: hypothetical protein ACO34E_07555 [Limisphaerales bacterium]
MTLDTKGGLCRWVPVVILAAVLLVGGFSCSSTPSGGKQFAVVTLRYTDEITVRRTVEAVFSEAGYEDASFSAEWRYERKTSTMQQLAHGGWFDEGGVRERVRLKLIPLSEGVYRLESQAMMVRNAGEGLFEEEVKMTRLKSRPYQKLLNEVAKRLGPWS